VYLLETDRYHFFEIDANIFKNFFTDIYPIVYILLTTDTDVPIFTYQYTVFSDILTKYFG